MLAGLALTFGLALMVLEAGGVTTWGYQPTAILLATAILCEGFGWVLRWIKKEFF